MNLHSSTVTLAQCVSILEARRLAVCAELHGYGSPVAACDADFSALAAERVPHPRED